MQLIWENCYRYNGTEHEISKCAKELETHYNVTARLAQLTLAGYLR